MSPCSWTAPYDSSANPNHHLLPLLQGHPLFSKTIPSYTTFCSTKSYYATLEPNSPNSEVMLHSSISFYIGLSSHVLNWLSPPNPLNFSPFHSLPDSKYGSYKPRVVFSTKAASNVNSFGLSRTHYFVTTKIRKIKGDVNSPCLASANYYKIIYIKIY